MQRLGDIWVRAKHGGCTQRPGSRSSVWGECFICFPPRVTARIRLCAYRVDLVRGRRLRQDYYGIIHRVALTVPGSLARQCVCLAMDALKLDPKICVFKLFMFRWPKALSFARWCLGCPDAASYLSPSIWSDCRVWLMRPQLKKKLEKVFFQHRFCSPCLYESERSFLHNHS